MYCFNPRCLTQSPMKSYCQRCGMSLSQQGYQAIAVLGQNQFRRTLLVVREAEKYVIHQSWNRRRTGIELPLRSLSRLTAIPALIEYFEQDEVSYLVQEYIQGEPFTKGILVSPAQIWQVLETLLPVLQQIHAQGLVHCDIKPENIIQTDTSQLVLVDFGAARLTTEPFHSAIGNPIYAAPEQMQGKVDYASDLYSLGVVCVHLLTGIAPFQLFDATTNQWVWQDYWLTATTNESKAIAQILDRLIAPNLANRFASTTEAIAQLEQCRGRKVPPAQLRPAQPSIATFSGHEGLFASVTSVAIAPNGKYIASASEDKTIRVWNVATGEEIVTLQGHTQFIQAVAFHPQQSELLLSAGRDRQIKLWNWTTQQEVFSAVAHAQAIHAIAFSPDGQQFISGSADKTIKLWSLAGEGISTFAEHRLAINAVAFAPCSSQIASASGDTTVRIWQTTPAKRIRLLTGHLQAVRAIAFSPNGQLLASGGEDKTIRLWEVESGRCIRVLPGHSWSVSALVFASDHTLISGSWDKTIKVWQVETGQVIEQFVGHTDSITSLAISQESNGRWIMSGSRDRTVKQWRLSAI